MLNNTGTYGPNEAPPNMVTSLNRPQSNAGNINHNFSDFGKFVQQAASSASGYYEAHNFHNFGQPPVNIPPMMSPFQAYQSMEDRSAYLTQNPQFSYENAVQNYFPAVSTTTQAENYNNMLINQHFHSNLPTELQIPTTKESYTSKGYSLNIPQVPSRILKKSPDIKITTNPQIDPENISNLSQGISQISTTNESQNISTNEDSDINVPTNLSPINKTPSENTPEVPLQEMNHDIEIPKNLSQKSTENTSELSPKIQRTSYNIIKNNNVTHSSIFEKCLSESKRKSLEKTVRLIESILVNSSNTKSEIIENTVDPLAFSPNPDILTNTSKSKDFDTESDNEALVKKVPSKNKRKSAKKSLTKINTIHLSKNPTIEIESEHLNVKIEDIKMEPLSWPDIDYGNPFHRDCNGIPQTDVDDDMVIGMENSVNEALAIIKNGSTTKLYFECPHCSHLLQHPKRFLIHVKWHTFGLLNEKRAEILKEREVRVKEKREARTTQRINLTLAAGDDADPRFPCKDCSDVFPTKTSLKNHRRKSHQVEVTECRICFVPVRGMVELRAHMTCHEAAGLHQCPRCPKRFKYRHSLAKHADTHREKTHSCPSCGKLFGSSALVRLHMKTHERAARGASHRCAYCGKGFYEAYNLQVHERTHRNDKPFKCDICESCFVTNSSLKRHIKVSHSGAKPFPCQVCQKCFASATIRDRHELRAHSDQQQFPHQCRLCPRRYMKPKDLRNHTYKMHPKEKKKEAVSDSP